MDKRQDNEEYEFSDLDNLDSGVYEEEEEPEQKYTAEKENTASTHVLRNACITLIVIAIAYLAYKFFAALPPKKPSLENQTAPSPVMAPIAPAQPKIVPRPSAPKIVNTPAPKAQVESPTLSDIRRQLSVLQVNQGNVRSEIEEWNEKISSTSAEISSLNQQLSSLTTLVASLSKSMEEQAQQLANLTVFIKKYEQKKKIKKTSSITYYLQAIIPGRAWLIATNGATLTVRTGSSVPGYGVVKLIEAGQGRVLMSSGKTIRFSEQDS